MDAGIADSIKYNEAGLVPAITQQHDTGEVLMLAWMNRESIRETLETKWVCYWSRSRRKLWRKGESSGHRLSSPQLLIHFQSHIIRKI